MKALIITCFESNEERVLYVNNVLKLINFETVIISTDFSHMRKEKRNNIPDNYIAINTKPYAKNLSLDRINSHRQFAKDTFDLVRENNPDLIWLMIPANSLLKEAKQYKEENSDVRIIVDVIDMWPESLPIRFNKNMFPFNIWRNIRKNNINCADIVVTECNMYQNILSNEYDGRIKTLYWAKENKNSVDILDLPEEKLSLCYLGSINNIIDIDKIEAIVSTSDMPVELHIIGSGENKEDMLERLSKVCYVIDHGIVIDDDKKAEILGKCHAGINIYKKGLYIGLTMKCIDYFRYGLPIINNIKGDSWDIVQKYNVGINIDDNTILDSNKLINMRTHNDSIYDLYKSNFSKDTFMKRCREIIDEVIR